MKILGTSQENLASGYMDMINRAIWSICHGITGSLGLPTTLIRWKLAWEDAVLEVWHVLWCPRSCRVTKRGRYCWPVIAAATHEKNTMKLSIPA